MSASDGLPLRDAILHWASNAAEAAAWKRYTAIPPTTWQNLDLEKHNALSAAGRRLELNLHLNLFDRLRAGDVIADGIQKGKTEREWIPIASWRRANRLPLRYNDIVVFDWATYYGARFHSPGTPAVVPAPKRRQRKMSPQDKVAEWYNNEAERARDEGIILLQPETVQRCQDELGCDRERARKGFTRLPADVRHPRNRPKKSAEISRH